jgi:hypothetical protein
LTKNRLTAGFSCIMILFALQKFLLGRRLLFHQAKADQDE